MEVQLQPVLASDVPDTEAPQQVCLLRAGFNRGWPQASRHRGEKREDVCWERPWDCSWLSWLGD